MTHSRHSTRGSCSRASCGTQESGIGLTRSAFGRADHARHLPLATRIGRTSNGQSGPLALSDGMPRFMDRPSTENFATNVFIFDVPSP